MRRITAWLMSFMLLFAALALPCSALAAAPDVFSCGITPSLPLNISGSLRYDVSENGTPSRESDDIFFRTSAGSFLSLILTLNEGENTPKARADVVSDDGTPVVSGESRDGKLHLTFLSEYSGIYAVRLTHISPDCPEFSYTLSVREVSAEKVSIFSLPYEEEAPAARYRFSPSAFFGKESESFYADDTSLVLYRFPVESSSVVCCRLTASAQDPDLRASLYLPNSTGAAPTEGHTGSGYVTGVAAEAAYSGTAYLLVAADCGYTLSVSCLVHEPFSVTDLSLPFSGRLTPNTEPKPLYNEEAFDALAAQFPFAGLKNRCVSFFRFPQAENSVYTLFCRPQDYDRLTFVSGDAGLSDRSVFPLCSLSSYASEVGITPLSYRNAVSVNSSCYLCCTGEGSLPEVSVTAAPTHKLDSVPEERISVGDPIPTLTFTSVYLDQTSNSIPDIPYTTSADCRIGGYVLLSDKGERSYFSPDEKLVAPSSVGSYSLYVRILCDYVRSDGVIGTSGFFIRACDFSTVRHFPFFPTIDVDKDTPRAMVILLTILSILPVLIFLLLIGMLILMLVRRAKKKKAAVQSDGTANTHDGGREDKQ